MERVLKDMQNIVDKYISKFGVFDRLRFTLADKDELPSLQQKLQAHINNLTAYVAASNTLSTWASMDQARRKKPVQSESNDFSSELATIAEKQDKIQLALDRLLAGESPQKTADLTGQLAALGVPKEDMESLKTSYNQTRLQFRNPPTQAIQESNVQKAQKSMKSTGSILCVDSDNGGEEPGQCFLAMTYLTHSLARSVIAQCYLELVRTWTANNTGHWLFDRAGSGGIWVNTDFSKVALKKYATKPFLHTHVPASDAAITALAGPSGYFASIDGPKEKETILNRIRKHSSTGIRKGSFTTFDYILCFDKYTRTSLEELYGYAQKLGSNGGPPFKAKIVMLRNVNQINSKATPDILIKTATQVKVAIQRFLKTELNWSRPSGGLGMTGGPFRTKEIIVPEKKKELVMSKLNDIVKQSGCRIHVTISHSLHGQLVSIIGPMEALPLATTLVQNC